MSGPGQDGEDCRAEGSLPTPGRLVRCLVQYSPKPAWSHALSGSCNLGHFLSWTRMIPFTATMRPIVPAVGRGNERPAGCPTRLAPAPRTPTRTGLAPPDRPAPSTRHAAGSRALTPEAAGPRANLAVTASECTTRPARGTARRDQDLPGPAAGLYHITVRDTRSHHGPTPNGTPVTFQFLVILCCTASASI